MGDLFMGGDDISVVSVKSKLKINKQGAVSNFMLSVQKKKLYRHYLASFLTNYFIH